MLIASLRDVIRNQSEEVEALQRKLKEATAAHAKEVCSADRPISDRNDSARTEQCYLYLPSRRFRYPI
jgi:predicted phage gp36 major capsid-like protein